MFFRETEEGIELHVRLTPRGGSDAIDGVRKAADGREHLAVRVRAVPERGAANAALETLLAAALGVARSSVSVTGGHASRLKTVCIVGDAGDLARRLTGVTGSR